MSILSTIFRGEKYIKQSSGYEKMSEWQLGKDVEYDDGKNGETKHGAIDGITSDINGTSDRVAASIKVVNDVDSKVPFKFGVDSDGNYGYIKAGADTVTPFKSGGHDFYGHGTSYNSWAVNIKRNSNILKVTGNGYRGNSANQTLSLTILGVSDETYCGTYHVYNGAFLPTISTVKLTATLATQEIDVSEYPRLVLYVVYGSGTSGDNTGLDFHIEN